jgi:hypothetical protein
MTRLYRSNRNSQSWYANVSGTWVEFPAGVGGWACRRFIEIQDYRSLQSVPLWLAFNTGLLEELESRRHSKVA